MSNTNNIKEFIHNHDYPNPDWSKVPEGFPNIDRGDLSRYENHLLDAIILAWYNEGGRNWVYKKFAQVGFAAISIVFVGLMFKNFLKSPSGAVVKQVSAATVSAVMRNITVPATRSGKMVIESTRSAVLRTVTQNNAEVNAERILKK